MVKLPVISAKALIKILLKYWAKEIRQKWSHLFIEFNWQQTTIPIHSNKELWKWLLKKIFNDLHLEELEDSEIYKGLFK